MQSVARAKVSNQTNFVSLMRRPATLLSIWAAGSGVSWVSNAAKPSPVSAPVLPPVEWKGKQVTQINTLMNALSRGWQNATDKTRKWNTTSCAGGRHNMPRPCDLDLWPFDFENGVQVKSRVTWATSVLVMGFCQSAAQNDWRVTWIIRYHFVQSSSKKIPTTSYTHSSHLLKHPVTT